MKSNQIVVLLVAAFFCSGLSGCIGSDSFDICDGASVDLLLWEWAWAPFSDSGLDVAQIFWL